MRRPRWKIPSDKDLLIELKEWNRATQTERLIRWKFLRQETEGPDQGAIVPSGLLGGYLFWEAGRSFVAGNFVATVILAQSFVEHVLLVMLTRANVELESRIGFEKLIDKAHQQGVINIQVLRKLRELRKLRNPYVHVDAEVGLIKLADRALMESGGDPYRLTERDARRSIEALTDFLRNILPEWHDVKDNQQA